MAVAKKDENGRSTVICVSNADGLAIVPLKADPTTHGLKISDGTTGSDAGNNGGKAMLDENSVSVWTALSSNGDGSIVEVYADPSTGSVLVKST